MNYRWNSSYHTEKKQSKSHSSISAEKKKTLKEGGINRNGLKARFNEYLGLAGYQRSLFKIFTSPPFGPGTEPLTSTIFSSASIFTIFKPSCVTLLLP